MRVPVPDGSLTDITCVLTQYPSVEQINLAFKQASEGPLKGILEYTVGMIMSLDPLVQSISTKFLRCKKLVILTRYCV
jgi:glyceraldehyde 3-phosphate dehydrogenase